MNNNNTGKKLSEKGEKRLMVFLVIITVILTILMAMVASEGIGNFVNTRLMPDAVNNSTARGLENYSVEENRTKLEKYGTVSHGYVSQELTVSLDSKYDSYITMEYDCEVDYYSRPDDNNRMNVPEDAKVKSIEITTMAREFDREEMIEFIKNTMLELTDVEVNDTYIRSLANDAADSLCTCSIVDKTHELFDVHYSVEIDSYMGYVFDVKVDVSKNM